MRLHGTLERTCVRMAVCAAGVLMIGGSGAWSQESGLKLQPVYKTFYLKNATGQNAANDISTMLRNMLPNEKIYFAASENALSVKGSPVDVATTEKILADIDRPQKTYRVTYTISGGDDSGTRQFVLVLTPGSKTISKQGTRVPIMTGAYKEGEGASANTQFQYVDIGLAVEASDTAMECGSTRGSSRPVLPLRNRMWAYRIR